MIRRHWRWPTALAAALGLLTASALTAYAARFGPWTEPTNLGPNVNSALADICAFETKSGLSLYFSSNGRSGEGGFDLYVAQRAHQGAPWGPAENLGPTVNGPFDEACPVLVPSGRELIFYSNRPGGAGNRDLYVAKRRDRRDDFGWEAPVNLGAFPAGPNTSSNEWFPTVFDDDDVLTLYFASDRPGLGINDVWMSTRGEDDDAFGPAVHVPALSSSANEGSISVRRDGLEIFVASNRPGTTPPPPPGIPGTTTDLWVATRSDTDEPWGTPVNSGPALATVGGGSLNTGAGESGGAYSRDGTTIYVTSTRTGTGHQGGIDIWQATRDKLTGDSTNP